MAEIVRSLPSAGFAFHAAGAMLSISYWLMRLLVSKALSKAVGSWLAKPACHWPRLGLESFGLLSSAYPFLTWQRPSIWH